MIKLQSHKNAVHIFPPFSIILLLCCDPLYLSFLFSHYSFTIPPLLSPPPQFNFSSLLAPPIDFCSNAFRSRLYPNLLFTPLIYLYSSPRIDSSRHFLSFSVSLHLHPSPLSLHPLLSASRFFFFFFFFFCVGEQEGMKEGMSSLALLLEFRE